ncbi:MAG: polymer-forming cytoskeletal protein [bacterium]|nr:polymer-forming cytoskeletal protein [bacterium]
MKKENGKIDSIDTILGQGIIFKGELKGDGNIKIDGQLSGLIEATGDVYIGKKAGVIGDCHVGSIIIGGKVKGNVVALKRVEILPDGELHGDILAPRICIADGVIFEGNCKISK